MSIEIHATVRLVIVVDPESFTEQEAADLLQANEPKVREAIDGALRMNCDEAIEDDDGRAVWLDDLVVSDTDPGLKIEVRP